MKNRVNFGHTNELFDCFTYESLSCEHFTCELWTSEFFSYEHFTFELFSCEGFTYDSFTCEHFTCEIWTFFFFFNKFRFLYNGLLNRTLGQSTIVDCYRDERNSLFRLSLRLVDVVDFMGTWKQHVKCCYFNCLYLNYLCMSCVHANSQMNCLYEKSL